MKNGDYRGNQRRKFYEGKYNIKAAIFERCVNCDLTHNFMQKL